MATINASSVISSTAAGPNFNYTIALANAGSSNAGIGTFWYAWVPGEDFLATSPISVSPPPGWSDHITNMGPGDGFAIQFLANRPANDVQPGSSLSFSFTSADSPASVNGNSVFYPGTPVGTSTVYPQGPFSDAGHQFDVTPAPTPMPTPTPTPTPSPTPIPTPPSARLVTVAGVQEVENRRHQVAEIVVDLSGPVNAVQADNVATFHLATANSGGSFRARNSPVIKLRSAVFNPANNTITLTPRKAFGLSRPVELTINGTPPSGLQDSSGQFIDGDNTGDPGGNAVMLIRRGSVTLNPVAPAASRGTRPARPAPPGGTRPVLTPVPPVNSNPTPAPLPPGILGSIPSPLPPVGIGPIQMPTAPPVGIGYSPPSGGGGGPIGGY